MLKWACPIYIVLLCLTLSGRAESPAAVPPEYLDSIVLLECIDNTADGQNKFLLPRVGFAVGDGRLILTADHCADDFRDTPPQSSSRCLLAISPYYGDLCPVKLLAYDQTADVALLMADWPEHPALALAGPNDIQIGTTVIVPSLPQFQNKEHHINTDSYLDRLTVEHIDPPSPTQAILFHQVGLIRPGWSGSPILLQDSGRVIGLMSKITHITQRRALFFKKTIPKAVGCHIQRIHQLIDTHPLHQAALLEPLNHWEKIPHSKTVFGRIQNTLNALLDQDLSLAQTQAQEAVTLRPTSAYLHLLLATIIAGQQKQPDSSLPDEEWESQLKTAVQLKPKDSHILAVAANLLSHRNKSKQARHYAQEALDLDPNNPLALYTQLTLLQSKDPQQAAKCGQRLVAQEPNNAMAWFYTSRALLYSEHPQEALAAGQQAVAINPNGLLREPLAHALAALDRTDEALVEYQYMAEHCGCESCWYHYCHFLVQQYPDRITEAQDALDHARSTSKKKGIPSNQLDRLQVNIYKQSDPNQAVTFLQTKLDQDPNNAHAWWCLADVLRHQTRYQEAAEAAQKAVDIDPNNRYAPRLANCLAKAGHVTAAQTLYDHMLTEHPERPRYWLYYAQHLLDQNRYEAALKAVNHITHPHKVEWRVTLQEKQALIEKIQTAQQQGTPTS